MVIGAVYWATFDVIQAQGLEQTPRVLWLLVIFMFPLIGPAVWLYAKSRPEIFGGRSRFGNLS